MIPCADRARHATTVWFGGIGDCYRLVNLDGCAVGFPCQEQGRRKGDRDLARELRIRCGIDERLLA